MSSAHPTKQRTALVCGISGHDGAYLAAHLLGIGTRVDGTSRDAQTSRFPIRLHGAGSSEMFGDARGIQALEDTALRPGRSLRGPAILDSTARCTMPAVPRMVVDPQFWEQTPRRQAA